VTFPVNPSISGNVAAGYRVAGVEVDPPFVNVRAPVDVLQSISVLTTDTIPVDGAESDVQRSVQLRLPTGATVDGGIDVVVRVRVEPAQGQRNLQIAVQTTGVKQGMAVSLAPDYVTVTIAGPLPVLDAIAADAVTAKIDVSDLRPNVPACSQDRASNKRPVDGRFPVDVQVTVAAQ
jgi:YbbR domain-containing protein